MAKGFRPVVRDQPFLLPPDVREWLPAGHLAWFVIDAVAALDVSRFAARVTPRGSLAGRARFDPSMLVALLVYGYATGVRSSRRIERACAEDVAFRVVCAQDGPDHATIARFRREHFADPGAVEELFGQVLVLAARAGLGRLGVIAVDGTKIAASASMAANRGEARLRELAGQIVAEADAVDAAEDELFGAARGDELPAELADPVTRRDRIAAALAGLEAERRAAGRAEQARAEAFRQRQREGRRTGCSPARAAAELAAEQVARVRAAQQAKIEDWQARNAARAAAGQRLLRGTPPVPADQFCQVRRAEERAARALARAEAVEQRQAARKAARRGPADPVRNVTDPDSRLMPVRGGGFIQGYNAQAVHSGDGLCLAAMVTADSTDYGSYQPMITKAQAAQDLLRGTAPGPLRRRRARIGVVLADAGYLTEQNLTCDGPDRLIATGKNRDLEKAASRDGPARHVSPVIAAMASRLATAQGIAAYRRRAPVAEAPFGNIKHNLGMRRFTLRGQARVNSEWIFQNATANLLKIHATGWTPATA